MREKATCGLSPEQETSWVGESPQGLKTKRGETMNETQKTIQELMSAYESKRAVWVKLHGNDSEFNAWFTTYISEQLNKAG